VRERQRETERDRERQRETRSGRMAEGKREKDFSIFLCSYTL